MATSWLQLVTLPHDAEDDDDEDDDGRRERVEALAGRLPAKERVIVHLSVSGLTQRQVAAAVGISQVSVLRRLRRAIARLQHWASAPPDVSTDELERGLADAGYPSDQTGMVVRYVACPRFLGVARELGVPYSSVRWACHRVAGDETVSPAIRAVVAHAIKGGLLGAVDE